MSNFVRVLVKAGHPTGTYSRGGVTFTTTTPVDLPADEATDEILNDPWLVCSDVDRQEFGEGGVPVESLAPSTETVAEEIPEETADELPNPEDDGGAN